MKKNPPSLNALVEEVRAKRARLLDRLRYHGERPFEASTSYGFVFVNRDPREPGKPWRITGFGKDKKPMGHATYSSFQALAKDLAAYGVHDADQIKTEGWSLNPRRSISDRDEKLLAMLLSMAGQKYRPDGAKRRARRALAVARGIEKNYRPPIDQLAGWAWHVAESYSPGNDRYAEEIGELAGKDIVSGASILSAYEHRYGQMPEGPDAHELGRTFRLSGRAADSPSETARLIHEAIVWGRQNLPIVGRLFMHNLPQVMEAQERHRGARIEATDARAARAAEAEAAAKKSAKEALAELKAERKLKTLTTKRATTDKAAAKARAKGLEIDELGPIVSEVGKGLREAAEARARGFEIGEGSEGRPHGFDIIDWEGGFSKSGDIDLREPSPARRSTEVIEEARKALQDIAPSIAWKFDKDPSATSLYEISNTLRIQRDPGREMHRLADRLVRLARELDEANRPSLSERDQLAMEAARGARAIELNNPYEPHELEKAKGMAEGFRRAGLFEKIEKRFKVKLDGAALIRCGKYACVWRTGESVVKITSDYSDAQAALAMKALQHSGALEPEIRRHIVDVREVCEIQPGSWVIVAEWLGEPSPQDVTAWRYFFENRRGFIFSKKIYATEAADALSILSRRWPGNDFNESVRKAFEAWQAIVRLYVEHNVNIWSDAHGGNFGVDRQGNFRVLDFGQGWLPSHLESLVEKCAWDKKPEWKNNPARRNPKGPRTDRGALFRSVSPWEMADILKTGEIRGFGAYFSGDQRENCLWFGTSIEGVWHNGEDWSRFVHSWAPVRETYELSHRVYDVLRLSEKTLDKLDLWSRRESPVRKISERARPLYDKIQKAAHKVQMAALDLVDRVRDATPVTSYVLELHGVEGGTLYTDNDSLNGAPEVCLKPPVPASKIAMVWLVKGRGWTAEGRPIRNSLGFKRLDELKVVPPKLPRDAEARLAAFRAKMEPYVAALEASAKALPELSMTREWLMRPRSNPIAPACEQIGRAYLSMPDESKTERARRLYAQYVKETERLFKLIKLRVEFTTDDPYKTAAEMREDALKNGRMKIFSGGEPHELLSQEANLRGRAVHDLLAHLVCGCPFTASGEYNAFEAQAALYSHELRPLLFTEIVGQSCAYVLQKGQHAEQKVLFLPEHLEQAAASQMRKRFAAGLGLAGIVERGWMDPAVFAIAESTGYALRYVYAVLENKDLAKTEGALMTNPGWSKQAVRVEAPKWARFL